MKGLLVCFVFVLSAFFAYSQQRSFLTTIEDTSAPERLKSVYPDIDIEIAFPSSRKALFKKVYRIRTTAEQSVSVLTHLKNNKAFKNIEKEETIRPLQTPNDYNTTFGTDYALDLINAPDAWDVTTGDSSVAIGISDTNFDLSHEELVGAYSTTANNFFHSNINHGTAVAITASGNTNNTVGKSSIGYNTKVILDNMTYTGLLNLSYAGAKVINASWASGCSYNNYHQQIINEIYENGTIIVAAAGNGSTCYGPESLVYPAAYEYVISVSSIGRFDNHERIDGDVNSTHQHNDSVDIVAPGYNVPMGVANNSYTTGNGSSFAAPFVSGTIALMLSVNPCLSYQGVLNILRETAADIYTLNPIYTGLLGAGRLDAGAAVEKAKNLALFNLEMLSDYDCINDQYFFKIKPEDTASTATIQWSNGSTDWTQYNQIEGRYDFTITRDSGCDVDTFIYYVPNQPIYDYTGSVVINHEHTTLHDFNEDGVIRIKGLLVIESNVSYNLTNKSFEFGPNNDLPTDLGFQESGIVVKPGGKLNIDNCQFSSVENCTTNWNGIELWGKFKDTEIRSNEIFQTKSTDDSRTRLTITNSYISNADVAIRNYRKNAVFGNTMELKEVCALVDITNSTFENNTIGVLLDEHHKNQLSHLISNSEFNAGDSQEALHLKLSNINTIKIFKTNFRGNTSAPNNKKGIGILAQNSSINSEQVDEQLSQSTENSFEDLYKGILLTNTGSSKYLYINDDTFLNTHKNLFLSGDIHTIVNASTFSLPVGDDSENSFALMTSNTNQLQVTNNVINGSSLEGKTFGFIIKNNFELDVNIFGNDFAEKMECAIQFEGVNHNVDFTCNTFEIEGEFDLALAEGSIIFNNSMPLNTFSSCTNVTSNIVNDINNTLFTYTTNSEIIPNCYSSGVIVIADQNPIDLEEACTNSQGFGRIDVNHTRAHYLTNLETIPQNKIDVNYKTASIPTTQYPTENKATIYPNPTHDNFTIKVNELKDAKQLIIYNQMGAVVKSYNLTTKTKSIEVKGLNRGAYTAFIVDQNGRQQHIKVIVQ